MELNYCFSLSKFVKDLRVSSGQVWLLTENDTECHALRVDPGTRQTLGTTSEQCASKRQTVCRLDASNTMPPSPPAKFPCLKLDGESRKKRDAKNLGNDLEQPNKNPSGNIVLKFFEEYVNYFNRNKLEN